MGPRLTPAARQLLLRQRGVIATWQAPEVGMNIRQLRHATTTGWQELTPRTILSSPDTPTSRHLRIAGLLESGPDAALTGCSALIESRWSGDDAGWVDVVVARDHRSRGVRTPAWLRVHSTLEVPRAGGTPTRVDPARATIDAAVWARTPRERLFIVTSAAQQRLVTTAQLRRELGTRGRTAWSTEVREIVESIDMGVTSTSEADFLRACRSRGLQAPRMQVRRVAGGRRRRVDAEFRLPDGRILMVEIDGVAHMDVRQWEADLVRQNELTAETGALVLHITGWQIRHDPDEFFDLLRRLGVP